MLFPLTLSIAWIRAESIASLTETPVPSVSTFMYSRPEALIV